MEQSQTVEREFLRHYDDVFGLWYVIYWDHIIKCYVTQLESGQRPVLAVKE